MLPSSNKPDPTTASPKPRRNHPAAPPPAPAPAAAPEKVSDQVLYVLDSTAQPDTIGSDGRPIAGVRTHIMLVDGLEKPFSFRHGVPLALPKTVAFQFLRHPEFKLTDAEGNPQPYQRQPKQPGELQAGEKLVLNDDETVARYDELSTPALQQRVLEIPRSEKFASEKPSRPEMIRFIVAHVVKVKETTAAKEPDITDDDFVPVAELEDEPV
jgi:hypothetical protein